MYACKLGVRAGLIDAKDNHPNDMVSLIFFCAPKTSSNDTGAARFNRVRVPLSRSYDNMIESLWYPPSTVGNSNATIRPYDSDNIEVPRAMGGTCYSMPLMLAQPVQRQLEPANVQQWSTDRRCRGQRS